ncbi:RNA polymerase sigma factor [Anaerocolumna xylanovorans]|uniref:RNA polymerase sigma-70 factor, ECF subfamily n=1 Tax=Anaerocolumna xylanovorans DSM 12503 TaxID=1121345 RepID=A0A1M7XWS5_9FIRM|nr:RNA polymerase sigma factor [Anaerocolumna xylanovorans]SHO43244.1 RNA polymerase sigma-70 factor, ECF subfamily [Anaerocolumna xylanovorans DSM 12503]
MIPDKTLYRAFLEGDISGFEELVLRHRHNLVYFIMQYLKDFHTAEDMAQEVFAYIYLHPDRYLTKYEFKTYLFMLGKRRAIDYLRKNSRVNMVSVDDLQLEDAKSLEDIIYQNENSKAVQEAIKEMKPEYSQAIILLYLNGFSLAETAAIMDKPVSSIKVLSHRAKNKLKEILQKGGYAYEI